MRVLSFPRVLFVASVAVLAGAPAARAQSGTPTPGGVGEVQLFGEEEVKIEAATKTSIPLSKAPGAVTVVTARQIRESGARTIPELLRLVAGVNVRWNPMVETIDMRGFGENPFTNRVLLLIDGVPYNDWNQGGFPQHPGLDFFVLQNVKRIEVVRGPGSSLYGENALWGVINIVSLSGEDIQGGRVEGFGGSRQTGSAGALYGHKLGEAGSIFLSAKYLHSQLPMKFWAEDSDSVSKGTDIFVKGTFKQIQASYYRHQDTMGGFSEEVPLGLPVPTFFQSAPKVGQTVEIAALRYDQNPKDRKLSFSANASYAHRFGTHCAACHASRQSASFGQQEDHGFQTLGDFKVSFTGIPGNEILAGVEGRHVDAGDHPEELAESAHAGHGYTYSKLAAYIQDQVSLANDKVRVVGGVRYDGKTHLFDSAFSPRVSLIVTPVEPLALRAGYSSAFRFPNFSELAQSTWFVNADGGGPFLVPLAVFRPNQALLPEQSRTFDAGAEYRLSANVSAKVDVFRSRLKRFIVMTPELPPPPALATLGFENHPDDAWATGIEGEIRWNVANKTTGFANYTRQKNEQVGSLRDSAGNPFEFVYSPESKANLGAYFGPFSGVRGAVEASWKGDYQAPALWAFINAQNSGVIDPSLLGHPAAMEGYTLLNGRLSYDLPIDLGKQKQAIRVTVYGSNLLDRTPRETLIGVDSRLTGREVFAEISVDFK
jgi:outer membrane receptor protein involved in Fe transport